MSDRDGRRRRRRVVLGRRRQRRVVLGRRRSAIAFVKVRRGMVRERREAGRGGDVAIHADADRFGVDGVGRVAQKRHARSVLDCGSAGGVVFEADGAERK